MWLTPNQKFGAALLTAGIACISLGIAFFMDRSLLAFGNLLFVSGLVLIIGPSRALVFFTRPSKIKGSLAFAAGIILILLKHVYFGFLIELAGVVMLFGDFLGVVVSFLRQMPVIGTLLSHPMVAPYVDRMANVRILPI